VDSTQALNTISSVSGAYNTRKNIKRYRRKENEGIVYDPVIPQAVHREIPGHYVSLPHPVPLKR
jgi:hypothetical protein